MIPRSETPARRASPSRARVLCVDDEPAILEGLRLHLGRRYELLTAESGPAALALLGAGPKVAVIISDMRMPVMSGAVFLESARQLVPEAVRILLTGQADFNDSMDAINNGHIFRYLLKPCPPPELLAAVDAAMEAHRVITAEKVLLEQTLRASVRALGDLLAAASPAAFGHASRVRTLAAELATRTGEPDDWQLDVAASLCTLGCVALAPEVCERIHYGMPLSPEERAMADRVPSVTDQLLREIPRLEGVRAIIAGSASPERFGALPIAASEAGDPAAPDPVARAAAILGLARDFDRVAAGGASDELALRTLGAERERYPAPLFRALVDLVEARLATGPAVEVRDIPVSALREGMVLAEDLFTSAGTLVAARGYELSAGFVERVRNHPRGTLREPLRVVARRGDR